MSGLMASGAILFLGPYPTPHSNQVLVLVLILLVEAMLIPRGLPGHGDSFDAFINKHINMNQNHLVASLSLFCGSQ